MGSGTINRPVRRYLAALAVSSFGLNWPWEMVQMPAYAEMAGRSWWETVPRCTAASVGDVALTLGVYAVGALAAGRLSWGAAGTWNVYAAAARLGAVFAAAVEWRSLSLGHWSSTARMPTVPVVGVGLWPFLQLTLLVPAALAAASWWAGGRGRQAPPGDARAPGEEG